MGVNFKEMNNKFKLAIEEYQCSGCVSGYNIDCFSKNENGSIGCGKHHAGTLIMGIGNIFLGMPVGFNRLGENKNLKPNIYKNFESCDWKYDMWNIPVWKYKNEAGHTIVRGIMPRRNETFIHIFLEDCVDMIDCLELYEEDIKGMD